MEEQKNKIINTLNHIAKYITTQGDDSRLVVAKDMADRLYISNYFSKAEMTDFIKNELTSLFNLTTTETSEILQEYEGKEKIMNDKLILTELKHNLQKISICEGKSKFLNVYEVERIVNYIVNNITIYDERSLEDFVMNDLVSWFELTEEEKQEVKERLENERKRVKKENI